MISRECAIIIGVAIGTIVPNIVNIIFSLCKMYRLNRQKKKLEKQNNYLKEGVKELEKALSVYERGE